MVDPSENKGKKQVLFGANVLIVDEETEEEFTYRIVGPYEADTDKGHLSIEAPIAKALIGKSQGDSVAIRTPKGITNYEIDKVWY